MTEGCQVRQDLRSIQLWRRPDVSCAVLQEARGEAGSGSKGSPSHGTNPSLSGAPLLPLGKTGRSMPLSQVHHISI